MEADKLEIFNREGRAIFEGNVRLWDDTGEIRCNRLEAFYVEGGDTIEFLKAYGDVEIERQAMYAEANYAEHSVRNDTAMLQEDAYVRRNKNEFWADTIWLDLGREEIRMMSNVRGHMVRTSRDTGVVR